MICPRPWDRSRTPVPSLVLQFPHSLFSDRPRPPPPSPRTTRLLSCQHTQPLAHHPLPLAPSPSCASGAWGAPGCFPQGAWVGSDREQTQGARAEMLSAYDWLGVPGWGSEKGLQWSRPLFAKWFSPPALQLWRGPGTGLSHSLAPTGGRGTGSPPPLETAPSLRFARLRSRYPPVSAAGGCLRPSPLDKGQCIWDRPSF